MIIKKLKTEQEFIEESVKFILQILQENPEANIALSGGTTPISIYKSLGKKVPQGNFFQVDERYVPANQPDSNQKMIRETLNPANFHAFDTSLPPEAAIEKYAQELPEQFDLTILGIGEDGHYASIFPHTKIHNAKTQHTTTENHAIKDRLTITEKPILESKNILILLKNKPEILKELQNPTKTKEDFPALKLLKSPQITLHYLQ